MFFSANELSLELLGIFKIDRSACSQESFNERNYDSLSIRIDGSGYLETKDNSYIAQKGDVLYLPKNFTAFQRLVKCQALMTLNISENYLKNIFTILQGSFKT